MPLPEPLVALADRSSGLVLRSAALQLGVDDRELRASVTRRELVRVRRGVYTTGERWTAADERARHLLRARAVLEHVSEESYLGSVTGLVAHGADLHAPDLRTIHLVRDGRSGRREAGCAHLVAELHDDDRTTVDGMRCCSAARSALDYARDPRVSLGQAVVAMDSLLHAGSCRAEELAVCADRARAWNGARRALRAVRLSDGRSESGGETLGRLVLTQVGHPPEELQYPLGLPGGDAYADYAYPRRRVVGEFDGKQKYGRLLTPDQSPSDVAWAERRREVAIEELGFVVVRFVWADLRHPDLVLRRLLEAFARAERLGLARAS